MKKEKKIFYTLRLPSEQLEYLRSVSKINFTTVTQYIVNLINKDMKLKDNG